MTKALTQFKKITRECFDHRFWMGVPVFKHAAQYLYSYRYESKAIEDALKKAFSRSDNPTLFGSYSTEGPDCLKVGVVAMSGENNMKPCLLANYSRDWRQHLSSGTCNDRFLVVVVLICDKVPEAVEIFGDKDYLCREDDPRKELLTWEA